MVLNYAHPLAKKLEGAWSMQERGGVLTWDSTRKIVGTIPAGAKWYADRSVMFTEQQFGITTSTPVNLGTQDLTLWAYIYLPGTSRGAFFHTGTSSNAGYSLGVGSGTMDAVGNDLITLIDGKAWASSGVAIGYGWHSVALTATNGAERMFIDGRLIYGPQAGWNPNPPADTVLYIGGHPWTTSRGITGRIGAAYVYSRPLLAAEMRALHADPYAFYQPVSHLHLKVGAAPGTTTVQLDWTDLSENEDGFSIERAEDAGAFAEIDTVGAGIETYDNVNVPVGHTYHYRVRAISAALGYSEYSNEADVVV